jgi:hypothetical protein
VQSPNPGSVRSRAAHEIFDFPRPAEQENYLKTFEKRNRRANESEIEQAAKAAECMALGDMMSGNWEVPPLGS